MASSPFSISLPLPSLSFSSLLLSFFFLLLPLLLFLRFYLTGLSLSRRSGIPWVSILPFLGKNHPHHVISQLARTHGPIFLHYVGVTNVFLCDADIIKLVLKDELVPKAPPGTTPCIAKFMDNHVLGANGGEHRKHKAIIEKFFRAESLRGYAEKYVEKILGAVERIREKEEERKEDGERKEEKVYKVEVATLMTQLALDVLGSTILGIEFNSLSNSTNSTVFSLGVFVRKLANPVRMMYPGFETHLQFQSNRELKDSVDNLSALMSELLTAKKEKKGRSSTEKADVDLLDLLLEATEEKDEEKRLKMSEVIGNTMVMIIAGHESTASALTWVLYFLSKHPEIQHKAHEEVDLVLSGSHPTIDSIKELHFITRIIKESMRLMAPVGEVPGRQCEEDTPIKGTDYVIPKGAFVTYSIWAVHRDPKHWVDPERFDPDRFLPENSKSRHPYAFMPFSAGKRPCLGQQFSMIEQLFAVSMILQRFRLLPTGEEIKLKSGIMSSPEQAWIRFVPRETDQVVHQKSKQ